MAKDYGDNLAWFLYEVENAEPEQVEDGHMEIYGETEEGADCSGDVDVRELCGAALDRIKQMEVALMAYAKYATPEAMERDIRLLNTK